MKRRQTREPLVSIVLCTYDRARLLRRAIRSVEAQRYANWQLVIVDDGSTDRTPHLLAPLPLRDPRIIVHRQANHGPAHARNTGLLLAEGEYICFLDSDDEYRPTHIGSRVAFLERYRSTDMLYGGLTIRGPVTRRYVVDLDDPSRRIHVKDCYVGGTFFLRRRIVARGYRFRPLSYGEDRDLMVRIRKRFRVRRVRGMATYVYHCETPDRLCDVFTSDAPGSNG